MPFTIPHRIIQQINFINNPKKKWKIVYLNIWIGIKWQLTSISWNNTIYLPLKNNRITHKWLTLGSPMHSIFRTYIMSKITCIIILSIRFEEDIDVNQHKNFQSNCITFITSKSLVMFPYDNHLLRQLVTFHKKSNPLTS